MTATAPEKRKLSQIILRIDDEHGHHIIRKHDAGWPYTIEGYPRKPDNYLSSPHYYFPYTTVEVAREFANLPLRLKQGRLLRS
jgi:hypothetical protein